MGIRPIDRLAQWFLAYRESTKPVPNGQCQSCRRILRDDATEQFCDDECATDYFNSTVM